MDMIEFRNRVLEDVTEECECALQAYHAMKQEGRVSAAHAAITRMNEYVRDLAESLGNIIKDADGIVDGYFDTIIADH